MTGVGPAAACLGGDRANFSSGAKLPKEPDRPPSPRPTMPDRDPAAPASALFWQAVTRLGEAQILLPAMAMLLAWLVWRGDARRTAWVWAGVVGAAATLTTVTKVAFMGWGLGYAPWNYAGISGHAMFAAAVMPMVARVAASSAAPRTQRLAVAGAVLLAALVAVSRVYTLTHSWSEVMLGFALGTAASVVALGAASGLERPPRGAVRALLAGLVVWFVAMPAGAPPSRTHDWVTSLSLSLSGRDEPHTRWTMLRAYRQQLRERGEPLPPPFRRGPRAEALSSATVRPH